MSDDVREEVRDRVPIEDLIRDYNVALSPAGASRLRALCPFHHEKTPSFFVNIEKQFYHCFGCKEHGDIFTFVEKMDHVDFLEALEILARKAGVPLRSRGDRAETGKKVALFDVLELAEDFYHRLLLEDARGAPGRKYLEGRRISPEMWKKFRLGYSPPEWEAFIRFATSKQVPLEVLERAGLARKREKGPGYHDYFHGRVMFPIRDSQKRVIGFGARTLGDEQPKYLNTPKTPLFEKGQVLYGLPQARPAIQREGRIAIMEGYTDAIMAHQEGLDHAVASLGTAFTLENARRLRGLCPKVDLIFDGDAAGQSATERSLDLLVSEDLDVRIFTVTTGKDPCDALLELGGAEFRRRLETEAVGIFEFKWRRTVAEAEARGEGPGGMARALDEVLALLGKLPNVVARKLHAKNLAERLNLDERDIVARLSRHVAGWSPAARPSRDGKAPEERNAAAGGMGPTVEELVLECLIAEPERARERRAQVPEALWPFGAVLSPLGPPEGTKVLSPLGPPEGTKVLSPLGPVLSPLGPPEGTKVSDGPRGADRAPLLSAGLRLIARAIDARLDGSGLDVKGLLGSLDDEEAREALVGILVRIDRGGGDLALGREYMWTNCLRELERKDLERRSRAFEREKTLARERGDEAGYLALSRDHLVLLRRLKGPMVVSSQRQHAEAKDSGENLRKGFLRDQEA